MERVFEAKKPVIQIVTDLVEQRSQKSARLYNVVTLRRSHPEHDSLRRLDPEKAVQFAARIVRSHAAHYDRHGRNPA